MDFPEKVLELWLMQMADKVKKNKTSDMSEYSPIHHDGIKNIYGLRTAFHPLDCEAHFRCHLRGRCCLIGHKQDRWDNKTSQKLEMIPLQRGDRFLSHQIYREKLRQIFFPHLQEISCAG